MAKVIATAAVRLTAEGKGLAFQFRRIISEAVKEASASLGNLGDGSTDGLVKDAERNSNKIKGLFGGAFGSILNSGKSMATGLASSLTTAVTSGAKLALIGTKAGIALAGISSLATGVVGLIGVLAQASGAAAILPAAFIALKLVSGTLKVALDGVGESFSALASGDAAAFQESLKGLAPAARSFVTEVSKVKPAFDKIKLNTQQALFEGLGKSVAPLAQRYLPLIDSFMTQIGRSANTGAKGLIDFANNGEVAGQTRLLLDNVNVAFQQLMPSIVDVASALLDVGQVGSDFLPGLTEGISGATSKFADFIRESAASGKLSQFIQNAIDTIKQLGQVLVQFGGAFGAIFKAAQQAGGGFLNSLLQIGTTLNQFLSSAEGQSALVGFFTSMRTIIASVLPVVTALAGVVGRDLAPILANLASTIGPAFLPVVEGIGTALRAAGPGIALFAKGFADVIQAAAPLIGIFGQIAGIIAGSLGEALSALAPAISSMAKPLAEAMPAFVELGKGLGEVLKAAAPLFPVVAQLAGVLAGALGKALQALAPALVTVAEALASGLVAIMPQLAPIIQLVATTLAQLLVALVPLIPAFIQIVQALLPILPPLLQLVGALLPPLIQLVQALIPIIVAVASVFADLIPIFTEVVQTIIGILLPPIQLIAAVASQVAQIVASVFNGMAGFIRTIFGAIGSFITGIWGSIVAVFTNAVNAIGNFVRGGFNAIRDFLSNLIGNIASAIGRGIDNIIGFFRDLPGNVMGFLGDLASRAVKAGEDIIGGIIRGLGNLAGAIVKKIGNIISDAWDSVLDFFGIGSPSKLAIKTFEFVGEGMVIGLDNMSKDVAAAAKDLSQTAVDGLNAPLSGVGIPLPNVLGGDGATLAGGSAPGGLVVNQTNVMRPGADVRQFANEVWKRGASDLASGNSTLNVGQRAVQNGVAIPGSVVDLGV
jgi:phage-related protein